MQGPVPFGRYELLERVAMGGMAEVFRARAVGPDGFSKAVCIKRILPQFCTDPSFVQMFIDEARLAARLQHANIVHIFDFDQVEGSYYIAMEFVDGRDLRAVIRQSLLLGAPLPPVTAAFMAAEICKGLHHAHRCEGLGLVHRDVSPHNVLVGMGGDVKVMDFGIAKAANRITHTSTGMIKGKLAYMAPEHAAGQDLDHRADQFSAALVLFEMLTGRRAYEGPEPVVLRKALEADVQPPSLLVPAIPPELDEIFLRAAARDPAARFADMKALERALTQFIYRRDPAEADLDVAGLMEHLFAQDARRPTPLAMPAAQGLAPREPSVSSQATTLPDAARPGTELAVNPGAETAASDPAALLASDQVAPTRTHLTPPAPVPAGLPVRRRSWPRRVGGAALLGAVSVLAVALVDILAEPPSAPAAVPAPLPAALPVPEPSPEPSPEPVVAASPEAAEPVVAPRAARPAGRGTGHVHVISSSGWAEVRLKGGKVLGETPLDVELPAGRQVLVFRNPETGRERSQAVQVRPGETVTLPTRLP